MEFYISRFKGMERLEFEVEVVTPLFLGGADTGKAELRVPSIKGALRFWWRAIHAHLSLETLQEKESKIFGSANNAYGKSKIQIRLTNILEYQTKNKANPLPHKKVKFAFPCFAPGDKFSLIIYGKEEMFDLFELFTVLGGLGKRSRRGFGSIVINKRDDFDYKPLSSARDVFNLLQRLCANKFETHGNIIRRNDQTDANYAFIKEIVIGETFYKDPWHILKIIGQSSHDNNSVFTGYAKGKERFASPVYVSVLKTSKGYKPIITTLNTSFKNPRKYHGNNTINKFKEDILSGGSK